MCRGTPVPLSFGEYTILKSLIGTYYSKSILGGKYGVTKTGRAKNRPHACATCGSTFAQKIHLDTHAKTVHGRERPFVCDLCDYSCANKVRTKIVSKSLIGRRNKNPSKLNRMNQGFSLNLGERSKILTFILTTYFIFWDSVEIWLQPVIGSSN